MADVIIKGKLQIAPIAKSNLFALKKQLRELDDASIKVDIKGLSKKSVDNFEKLSSILKTMDTKTVTSDMKEFNQVIAESTTLTKEYNSELRALKRIKKISTDVTVSLDKVGIKNADKALDNFGKVITKEIKVDADNVKTLKFDDLLKSFSKGEKDVKKVDSSLKDLSRSSFEASNGMKSLGVESALAFRRFGTFTIAVGAFRKLTRTITSTFRETLEFERQLVRVGQVAGKTRQELTPLRDEIFRLAVNFGVASDNLAQSALTLSQAGLNITDVGKSLEALAKTELAPTFGDITATTQAAVAIFSQFGISADQLEGKLDAINTVAARFPVESEGIATAIRKTGGIFKASGGDLEELIALFTAVQGTTRESADSVATGLRTIFARLQRGDTVRELEKLGVRLRDEQTNLFVGPFEAFRELNRVLGGVDPASELSASVRELLSGVRQLSRLTPLIGENFQIAEDALVAARGATGSLQRNAEQAQDALLVKLTSLREEFKALIESIQNDATFREFAALLLEVARAAVRVADALRPLVPLIAVIAGTRIARGLRSFGPDFVKTLGMNNGGLVPGRGPDRDSVPATLTPGEFVLRRRAVDAIGVENLKKLNDGGLVDPFTNLSVDSKDSSSLVIPLNSDDYRIGQIAFDKGDRGTKGVGKRSAIGSEEGLFMSAVSPKNSSTKKVLEDKYNAILTERASLGTKPVTPNQIASISKKLAGQSKLGAPVYGGTLDDESVRTQFTDFRDKVIDGVANAFKDVGKGDYEFKPDRVLEDSDINKNFVDTMTGFLFENYVSALSDVELTSGKDSFDFVSGKGVPLSNELLRHFSPSIFDSDTFLTHADAKSKFVDTSKIVNKAENQGLFDEAIMGISSSRISQINPSDRNPLFAALDEVDKLSGKNPLGFNRGGANDSADIIPALLTPGEYVLNKEAVKRIGVKNLEEMNQVQGFTDGGIAGAMAGGINMTSGKGLSGAKLLAIGAAISMLSGTLSSLSDSFAKSSSGVDQFGNTVETTTSGMARLFQTFSSGISQLVAQVATLAFVFAGFKDLSFFGKDAKGVSAKDFLMGKGTQGIGDKIAALQENKILGELRRNQLFRLQSKRDSMDQAFMMRDYKTLGIKGLDKAFNKGLFLAENRLFQNAKTSRVQPDVDELANIDLKMAANRERLSGLGISSSTSIRRLRMQDALSRGGVGLFRGSVAGAASGIINQGLEDINAPMMVRQAGSVLGAAGQGAAFGSAFGPMGTAVGAAAGGLLSLATEFDGFNSIVNAASGGLLNLESSSKKAAKAQEAAFERRTISDSVKSLENLQNLRSSGEIDSTRFLSRLDSEISQLESVRGSAQRRLEENVRGPGWFGWGRSMGTDNARPEDVQAVDSLTEQTKNAITALKSEFDKIAQANPGESLEKLSARLGIDTDVLIDRFGLIGYDIDRLKKELDKSISRWKDLSNSITREIQARRETRSVENAVTNAGLTTRVFSAASIASTGQLRNFDFSDILEQFASGSLDETSFGGQLATGLLSEISSEFGDAGKRISENFLAESVTAGSIAGLIEQAIQTDTGKIDVISNLQEELKARNLSAAAIKRETQRVKDAFAKISASDDIDESEGLSFARLGEGVLNVISNLEASAVSAQQASLIYEAVQKNNGELQDALNQRLSIENNFIENLRGLREVQFRRQDINAQFRTQSGTITTQQAAQRDARLLRDVLSRTTVTTNRPEDIGNRLRELQERRQALAMDTSLDVDGLRVKEFGALNREIAAATEGLKMLRDSSQEASKLQEQLTQLQQRQKAAAGVAERFAVGTAQERMQIQQELMFANQLSGGGVLGDIPQQFRAAALQMVESLRGEEAKTDVLRRTIGPQGDDLFRPIGDTQQGSGMMRRLEEISRIQESAAQELLKSNQEALNTQNENIQLLVSEFKKTLFTLLDGQEPGQNQMARKVEISGKIHQKLDVNIHGAEILRDFEPMVRRIAQNAAAQLLQDHIGVIDPN